MSPISLQEANGKSLLNRVDTKFYFEESKLKFILSAIKEDYDVLEINEKRLMPYLSSYWDTHDFQMWHWHQNGKLNRFKIRKRCYILTGQTFVEVKKKTNKGKTEKVRCLYSDDNGLERDFIEKQTPFRFSELQEVLKSKFYRVMFVHKRYQERLSIDMNIGFSNGNDDFYFLDKLVVIEVKANQELKDSSIKYSLDIYRKIERMKNDFPYKENLKTE
jgi:hypothetical protein